MSSDDLKKKRETPAETHALFNAHISYFFQGNAGRTLTGEGKKFIYGAFNPPVTREDGSEKKRLGLLLGMSYTST